MPPSSGRTLRIVQLIVPQPFNLCICYLVFSNRLKWVPSIFGAFLWILPPLLYSAPQFPAASASPKSDLSQLRSSTILCLGPHSLSYYLESTSQQTIRVIIVLSSFVSPPIGITILCCLYFKKHIVVSYVLFSILFVYSGRATLALVTLSWPK